jgi:hypothetical protein
MIRHIVLLRFKDGTRPEAVAAMRTALETLPGRIAEIRRFEVGEDLDLVEGTFDFVVMAEFDDEDGYRTYATHPEHTAVSGEWVLPITEQLARVQIRIG